MSQNVRSNRWSILQEATLIGIITCIFIHNGALFKKNRTQACKNHVYKIYNLLVRLKLPPKDRIHRAASALFKRFTAIKFRTRHLDKCLIAKLWTKFLDYYGFSILLNPLFDSSLFNMEKQEIARILTSEKEIIDIRMNQKYLGRETMWTLKENCCLVRAVVFKFLLSGSFFPPKREDGSESAAGDSWLIVYHYYCRFMEEMGLSGTGRTHTSIARHFKDLKQRQKQNLIKFYAKGN